MICDPVSQVSRTFGTFDRLSKVKSKLNLFELEVTLGLSRGPLEYLKRFVLLPYFYKGKLNKLDLVGMLNYMGSVAK